MDDRTCTHPQWPYDGEEWRIQRVTLEYRIDSQQVVDADDLSIPGLTFKKLDIRNGYAVLTFEYEYEPTEDFTESDIETEIDNMLYDLERAGKLHEDHFILNTQPYIDYEDK
jgi:hypothetical protein